MASGTTTRSTAKSAEKYWDMVPEPVEDDPLAPHGIVRTNKPFVVKAPYKPAGDQPQAIAEIARRLRSGEKDVVLQGATGTGKTATAAWVIEKLQRPTLIIEPNKTLAAQLCSELRELMPDNAVNYFVSYYDYYQPEAYIPQTDTYIEKDSDIDDDVERLRHATTASLLTRRDCVVVATVSCIYGLGTPQEYAKQMLFLKEGEEVDRQRLLRKFVSMQYKRNDVAFTRGTFRVRGDTIEIIPVYEENAIRIEFFGDEIDRIALLNPVTGDEIREEEQVQIFPATQYANGPERTKHAVKTIQAELDGQVAKFKKEGKLLEAERLQQRTTYDLEMISQIGSCSGIENYSRHFDQRAPGTPPNTLLDFFPDDFLLIIDESHVTVPQIGAMYNGDRSRKRTLVQYGFRLPSALDNRPLKFDEFEDRIGQTLYMSATPGDFELDRSDGVVEQIIRPTGLLDPKIEVRPTKGQIDDLLDEINERVERHERVLVTTLTKKMAEDLSDYLLDHGVKVRYLHSDIDTLKRVELLASRAARARSTASWASTCRYEWASTCLEVSLVAILDADKEGFRARTARSSRRSAVPPATCTARSCMPTAIPTRRTGRSPRPPAAARSRGAVQQRAPHHPAPAQEEDHRRDRHDRPRGGGDSDLLKGGYRTSGSAANTHFGISPRTRGRWTKRHEHRKGRHARRGPSTGSSATSMRRCARRPTTCSSSSPRGSVMRSATCAAS